jgi:acyl carrier protein
MTNKDEIRGWLSKRLGTELNVSADKVDPRKPFVEYGIDSASAVGVVADLEDLLGRPLDPNLFYTYPTIQELADHLAASPLAEEQPRKVAQAT